MAGSFVEITERAALAAIFYGTFNLWLRSLAAPKVADEA